MADKYISMSNAIRSVMERRKTTHLAPVIDSDNNADPLEPVKPVLPDEIDVDDQIKRSKKAQHKIKIIDNP